MPLFFAKPKLHALLALLGLFTFLGMALSGPNTAKAGSQGDVRIATINGRPVAYRILGSGRPIVVMLSGLGDGMDSFRGVAPDLATGATIILYDRAGYGGSAPGPEPRDAVAVERELSGLLSRIGLPGPYVLVGHSLGGSFAEYYAGRHPDQVAGLILENSRPADFKRRCLAVQTSMCAPTVAMMPMAPAGAKAETAALDDTMKELASTPRLAGKPVLVLSGAVGANPTPFDTVWRDAQADLAAAYPGSHHLTASDGGHYIHYDQRDWFVSVVRGFLAGLR